MQIQLQEGETISFEIGNYRFNISEDCCVISKWSGLNWIDIASITEERFLPVPPERLKTYFDRDSSPRRNGTIKRPGARGYNARKLVKARHRGRHNAENTEGAA